MLAFSPHSVSLLYSRANRRLPREKESAGVSADDAEDGFVVVVVLVVGE